MKQLISSFVLVIGFISMVYSQSFFERGIVITNMGDTLQGLIATEKFDRLTTEISFKSKKEEQAQRFTPDDVKGFYIASNNYFESHSVVIKDNNGQNRKVKRFLHRIEPGYISIYKHHAYSNTAYYLKKEGIDTISVLFFTAKSKDAMANKRVDTLYSFDFKDLTAGDYSFGIEHVRTISRYFTDWKTFTPKDFKLTEFNLIQEVRRYNKNVHPQFSYPIYFKKEKRLPVFVLNISGVSPILPLKQLQNNLFSNLNAKNISTNLVNKPILGYELSGGIYLKNQKQGIGFELGYSKMAKTSVDYNYVIADNPRVPNPMTKIYNGNIDFIRQSVFLRFNYLTMLSTSLSPYISFGVSKPFIEKAITEYEQGSSVPRTTIYASLTKQNIEVFAVLGLQYTLNAHHIFRTEFDLAAIKGRTYRSFVRMGYQYQF